MSLLLTGRPGKGFRETAFFQPRSVWLRADPDVPESAVLARNLAAGGFKGSLMGDGFAALEGAPDLAILCVRPEAQAAELARLGEHESDGQKQPWALQAALHLWNRHLGPTVGTVGGDEYELARAVAAR